MSSMKGFLINIEKATLENKDFRRVLYTAKHSQLVLMCLKPGEEIGEEKHELDQFIRIEAGMGKVILDGVSQNIAADQAIIIPEGAMHNIVNTGAAELKLYTIYSPPEHLDAIVHATKEAAQADDEHFDGQTME